MKTPAYLTSILAVTLLAACGGSSSGGSGAGCGTSVTVSIAATGVSLKTICVVPGGSVTFTNADTVSHTVAITGTGCPAGPGPLAPMASGTATFPTATTCQFSAGATTAFQGTITVNANPPPGY